MKINRLHITILQKALKRQLNYKTADSLASQCDFMILSKLLESEKVRFVTITGKRDNHSSLERVE